MAETTPPYHLDSQMSQRTHSPPASVNSIDHEAGQSNSMAQEENGSLSEVMPTEVYWASVPSSPSFGAFRSLIAESEVAQFPQALETGGSPGTSDFGQLGAFDALDLNQDFQGPENSDLHSPQPSEQTENIFPEMGLDATTSVGFGYHMTSAPSYPGVQSQPMELGSSDQMPFGGNMYPYGYNAVSGLTPGAYLTSNLLSQDTPTLSQSTSNHFDNISQGIPTPGQLHNLQTGASQMPPRFICSICRHSYTRKYELHRHQRTSHTGIKPFECGFNGCPRGRGNGFGRKDHLKQHMRQIHHVVG